MAKMIKQNSKIYFLGIGGIGMSALARWCKNQGAQIYGYDLQPGKITDQLISEGMIIHFTPNVDLIPENIDMVVYTPAIPQDNLEYCYLKETTIPILKRAELIGRISQDFYTIAIAGTHGKTSISALTSHIFKTAGQNISAFVGGICRNYNSNLILSKSTDYLIVEADEFDRSLLHISPNIAVVSSIDEDHLDIYDDYDDIKSTFEDFISKLNSHGTLIYQNDLGPFESTEYKKITYSASHTASTFAENIRIKNGKFLIDVKSQSSEIKDLEIQVPGLHNIENTLAAISISLVCGLTTKSIKQGIETFLGVERRMDYRINNDEIVYIDDYAHHPEEIKATISAIKMLYPNNKITGIFQPHLYSRTRDFATEFAKELDNLDEILLMEIYPAREKPIIGITTNTIKSKMKNNSCWILDKTEILDKIRNEKPEVLLTLGAGDIGLLVTEIENEIL
jgi:UDP-N-acetylmuramate--alanine ligase